MSEDELNQLSEKGLEQYKKYRDYYDGKYQDYGGSVDFVAFVEREAKNDIKH